MCWGAALSVFSAVFLQATALHAALARGPGGGAISPEARAGSGSFVWVYEVKIEYRSIQIVYAKASRT